MHRKGRDRNGDISGGSTNKGDENLALIATIRKKGKKREKLVRNMTWRGKKSEEIALVFSYGNCK